MVRCPHTFGYIESLWFTPEREWVIGFCYPLAPKEHGCCYYYSLHQVMDGYGFCWGLGTVVDNIFCPAILNHRQKKKKKGENSAFIHCLIFIRIICSVCSPAPLTSGMFKAWAAETLHRLPLYAFWVNRFSVCLDFCQFRKMCSFWFELFSHTHDK